MQVANWYFLKCQRCRNFVNPIVVTAFGFDENGTLYLTGICRNCFGRADITHTREEYEADIRESFNEERRVNPDVRDFRDWEQELGDDNP
jgi:hypothetical protein